VAQRGAGPSLWSKKKAIDKGLKTVMPGLNSGRTEREGIIGSTLQKGTVKRSGWKSHCK